MYQEDSGLHAVGELCMLRREGIPPESQLATAAVQSIRITRIVNWLVLVTAATTLDASIIDNVIPWLAFSSG